MRVLVCGSREWDDRRIVFATLDGLVINSGDDHELVMIHGGARGADAFADEWAQAWHYDISAYPADWDTHGKAAGPIRNQRMLDEGKPDVVIAFKDGFQRDPDPEPVLNIDGSETGAIIRKKAKGGTEDMVRRAKAAGIPVYIVSHG